MITLLDETQLLVDRITAKTTGITTIAPLDDYPNGGNFEADVLPACFIGDAGDAYKFVSKHSLSGLKDGYVFASIVVERKAGCYQQSKDLLAAVANAVLYEDGSNFERWQPEGFLHPFTLADQRGPAIYLPTLVIRNIVFTSNQRLD